MTATIVRICEACEMEFNWPGVAVGDEVFCCDACSEGEPCTCPEHRHDPQTDRPLSEEEAEQLGIVPEPVL